MTTAYLKLVARAFGGSIATAAYVATCVTLMSVIGIYLMPSSLDWIAVIALVLFAGPVVLALFVEGVLGLLVGVARAVVWLVNWRREARQRSDGSGGRPPIRVHARQAFDWSVPITLTALPVAVAGLLSNGSTYEAQVHGTSWVLLAVALVGRVALELFARRQLTAEAQAPTMPPA